MNPNAGISAAERLTTVSEAELEGMLIENADEPYAAVISHAIMSQIDRKHRNFNDHTAKADYSCFSAASSGKQKREEEIKKSCQRCFQALRIDVNEEFEALDAFLEKLPTVLASGGRVAILSFHWRGSSCQKSFQRLFREGIYREVSDGPIRPSAEYYTNSRAKCAKLRWAIKA